MIDGSLRNHGQAVVPLQLRQQFIGHQRSAETGSDNNNFRHIPLRLLGCCVRLRQLSLGLSSPTVDYIFISSYIRKYEN
jgi:hypothetical protein